MLLEQILVGVLELVLLEPLVFLLCRKNADLFSPLVVFIGVYWLYFGFPSLVYLFYHRPFIPNMTAYLNIGLVYEIVGALAFYIGYSMFILAKRRKKTAELHVKERFQNLKSPSKNFILVMSLLFSMISICSLLYFMHSVGGFKFYLTHLGETNALTVGKVYFLWGILLVKLGAVLVFAFFLFKGHHTKGHWAILLLYILIALGIVTLIGARQMVVVGAVELVVLYHYLYKRINPLLIIVFSCLVILFILVSGEYRLHTFVQKRSFISQLENTYSNFNSTATRLTNNYFDSVQTFTTVLYYTSVPPTQPHLSFEYGRTYLSLIVQPIPRRFRPNITLGDEAKFFCAGGKGNYCRVISSLGELYLNFGPFGIIFGMLIFGYISAFVGYLVRRLSSSHNLYPWIIIFYSIYVTGIMVGVRGYFIGAATSVLMDFVPLLIAFLLLYFIQRKAT